MDTLTSIRVFRQVVESGTFVAAAERMDLSTAMVSKHVMQVEKRLGVRLLNRNSRTLSLTEPGRVYFERCKTILEDLEATELELGSLGTAPRGTLRITCPSWFASQRMADNLAEFRRRYPEIVVDVSFEDRHVDLVEEGYDLALRVVRDGALVPGLIARPLRTMAFFIAASREYLKRNGAPESPEDLARHDFVAVGNLDSLQLMGPKGKNRGSAACGAALPLDGRRGPRGRHWYRPCAAAGPPLRRPDVQGRTETRPDGLSAAGAYAAYRVRQPQASASENPCLHRLHSGGGIHDPAAQTGRGRLSPSAECTAVGGTCCGLRDRNVAAAPASLTCSGHIGCSFIRATPAAAQRLEDGDLVLYQGGVGRSHRGVDRDQGLLGGEQVDIADRARQELFVRHAKRYTHLILGVAERLAIAERRTVQSERLLGLFERGEHHAIERRQRRRLLGLGLAHPSARCGHIREMSS